MKRLTKKDKYGHFYTKQANCRNIWSSDGKELEGEYFENKTLAIDGKAIDKLGLLEDIEEELGIDLITLLKALTNVVYYKDIFDKIFCTINVRISCPKLIINGEILNEWYITFDAKCVCKIKDYGRTWALTKEELENDKI